MRGIEPTRRLRGMETSHLTTIIALTANAFVYDENELLSEGLDAVISKPLNVSHLLISIGQMLHIDYIYNGSYSSNPAN